MEFTDALSVEWSVHTLVAGPIGDQNNTPFCLLKKNIKGNISKAY